jgi:hypothetical protein
MIRMKALHNRKLLFLPLLLAGLALVFLRPTEQSLAPDTKTAPEASASGRSPDQLSTETTAAEAETQTPEPALQVAATVRGYRASLAERADYSARLATESNLLLWSQTLKDRANTGDADAAASLSALYSYCAEVLAYPFVPRPAVANRPQQQDPNAAAKQRCTGMGEPGQLTAFNLRSDAKAWKSTAAHLGHGPSVLETLVENREVRGYGPIHAGELAARAAAEDLLREGNYAELAMQSSALSQLSDISDSLPWTRSLCALAEPCGNGRHCQRVCRAEYSQRLVDSLPPRANRVRAGQELQILQALQSGTFAPLWRTPSEIGGRP